MNFWCKESLEQFPLLPTLQLEMNKTFPACVMLCSQIYLQNTLKNVLCQYDYLMTDISVAPSTWP